MDFSSLLARAKLTAQSEIDNIKAALRADVTDVEAYAERLFHLGAAHHALQSLADQEQVELAAAEAGIRQHYDALRAGVNAAVQAATGRPVQSAAPGVAVSSPPQDVQ